MFNSKSQDKLLFQPEERKDYVVEFYEGDGAFTRIREKHEVNLDLGDI